MKLLRKIRISNFLWELETWHHKVSIVHTSEWVSPACPGHCILIPRTVSCSLSYAESKFLVGPQSIFIWPLKQAMGNPSNSHIEEAPGLEAMGRKVCGMNNGSGNHKRPSTGLHTHPSVTEWFCASRLNLELAENLFWPEAWGSAHRLRGRYCGESLPPVIACQSPMAGVSAAACEASNNIYWGLHQLIAFHNNLRWKLSKTAVFLSQIQAVWIYAGRGSESPHLPGIKVNDLGSSFFLLKMQILALWSLPGNPSSLRISGSSFMPSSLHLASHLTDTLVILLWPHPSPRGMDTMTSSPGMSDWFS